MLLTIVASAIVISLSSLVGIFALSLRERTLHGILFVLVAFSAGTILGTAYLDLLPESMKLIDTSSVFAHVTVGFVLFFFLERFIYWYHGHGHEADLSSEVGDRATSRSFAYLNLVGDGIHNFVDGMVLAASYLTGFSIGLAATVAIIFHELPQEMGDYGILVYMGFERGKALLLNFAAAFTVVLGGILGVIFIEAVEALSGLLIAYSAGGFIYLAASELIPELHKERDFRRSVVQFLVFLLGICLIWTLGAIFPD